MSSDSSSSSPRPSSPSSSSNNNNNNNNDNNTNTNIIRAEEMKSLGNNYYSKGDYDQAIIYYSKSIQLNPSDPAYYSNRSAAYLMIKPPKYFDAITDASIAIRLSSALKKAYQRLIKCFISIGEFKKAKELIEKIRSIIKEEKINEWNNKYNNHNNNSEEGKSNEESKTNNNNNTNNNKLDEDQLKLIEIDSNNQYQTEWKEADIYEKRYIKAREEYLNGNYKYALTYTQSLMTDLPSSLLIRLLLAEIFLSLKQIENAQTLINSSNSLFRQASQANTLLSSAISSNYSSSSSSLSLSSSFPTISHYDLELLKIKGLIFYYDGELDKSIKCLQEALRLDPDHNDSAKLFKKIKKIEQLKTKGNQAYSANRVSEAISFYSEALEIDDRNDNLNAVLLCNRAAAEMKRGRYSEAAIDCSRAISIKPGYLKAYMRRAQCRMDLKAYAEAITDYESAIKHVKDDDDSSSSGETHYSKKEIRRLIRTAKLELKKSQRKDHYAILGLEKNATQSDIKKAYRKMALLHHPDKRPEAERKEAEARFKDITSSYELLSDEQQKRRYDLGMDLEEELDEEDGGGGGGRRGGGGMNADIFRMFMQQQGGGMGGMRFGGMGGGFRGGSPFGGSDDD